MNLCCEQAKEGEDTGKGPVTQGGTGENFIKKGKEMVWGPGTKPVKFCSDHHHPRPQLTASGLGMLLLNKRQATENS